MEKLKGLNSKVIRNIKSSKHVELKVRMLDAEDEDESSKSLVDKIMRVLGKADIYKMNIPTIRDTWSKSSLDEENILLEKIYNNFCTKSYKKIDTKSYITRILNLTVIPKSIILRSAFQMVRVAKLAKTDKDKEKMNSCRIKIFSTFLFIYQKLFFDFRYKIKDFSQVVGINYQLLSELEVFLIISVINSNIFVNEEILGRFFYEIRNLIPKD